MTSLTYQEQALESWLINNKANKDSDNESLVEYLIVVSVVGLRWYLGIILSTRYSWIEFSLLSHLKKVKQILQKQNVFKHI